jgi:hypothetical protein
MADVEKLELEIKNENVGSRIKGTDFDELLS